MKIIQNDENKYELEITGLELMCIVFEETSAWPEEDDYPFDLVDYPYPDQYVLRHGQEFSWVVIRFQDKLFKIEWSRQGYDEKFYDFEDSYTRKTPKEKLFYFPEVEEIQIVKRKWEVK